MSHQGDTVGVEIEVSFAAYEGRVVRGGEYQCLRTLVIRRNHLMTAQPKGLRLLVKR